MSLIFAAQPCHCDLYGVVHARAPECDYNYDGPSKPEAMSMYGPDPITVVLNNLLERIAKLEAKVYE